MGLKHVEIMISFVCILDTASTRCWKTMSDGLKLRENGLNMNVMAERPSHVFLAEESPGYCDGFSVGTNDFTQLLLILGCDSGLFAHYFVERNLPIMLLGISRPLACNTITSSCGIRLIDYSNYSLRCVDL